MWIAHATFLVLHSLSNNSETYMELYTVEELKELSQGDEIYVKYLELPASKDHGSYDGTCEVVVNNEEFLTTSKEGIEFNYNRVESSEFATIMEEFKTLQIYKV